MPSFTACLMLTGSVTSSRVTRTSSRSDSSFSLSGERMVAITFHPLAAKVFALNFPKPLDAPVIKTVFLFIVLRSSSVVRRTALN